MTGHFGTRGAQGSRGVDGEHSMVMVGMRMRLCYGYGCDFVRPLCITSIELDVAKRLD